MADEKKLSTLVSSFDDRGKSVRIYDLDGSVLHQSRLIELLGDKLDVLDLRDIGPDVRYLPSNKALAGLDAAALSRTPCKLAFTGSGDFHHVSASILKQHTMPLSLIVFDYHSDWIGSSPCPCGSWILEALKMPNIEKIVVIGMGSNSILNWRINHGSVSSIFSGRVEFYPYECRMSRCLGRRKGQPDCAKVRHGLFCTELLWQTISGNDWEILIKHIADRLPTKDIYISIDKDCLRAEYALTNWEPGYLTLQELLSAIDIFKKSSCIIGVDITGEYSEVRVRNPMLQKLAEKIHPKIPACRSDEMAVNESTNLALVEAFGDIF